MLNMCKVSFLVATLLIGLIDASDLGQDKAESAGNGGHEFILKQQFARTYDGHQLQRLKTHRSYRSDLIANIEVGQQTFRVLLDSTSGDLWLPITTCNGINKNRTRTYDQTKSSTHIGDGRLVKLVYDNSLTITGHTGRELVKIANLELKNQAIIQAHKISGNDLLKNTDVDGILGLNCITSLPHEELENPIHDLLRVVGASQSGGKSILSFSLNHGDDTSKSDEMIIGGIDESLYTGEITWTPLMRSDIWQFRVDSIELKYAENAGYWGEDEGTDLTVCQHGCDAIVNTGNKFIWGYEKDIEALNKNIGAWPLGDGNSFIKSCKDVDYKLPVLSITISGRKFSLKPSQYTFDVGGLCKTIFMTHNRPHWNLGTMFLGQFYSIIDFDNHRFGLAESTLRATNGTAKGRVLSE